MFSGKKSKGVPDSKDVAGDKDYLASSPSSGSDFSSGMSGGFSANSKEDYQAAKVAPPSLDTPSASNPVSIRETSPSDTSFSGDSKSVSIEFRKLDAKIESIVNWIKSFHSSFSQAIEKINKVSESLNKNNERVVEIETKIDSKDKELSHFSKDLEDLKKRAEVFIGTEELLKLNDEIKKNLDKAMQRSSGSGNDKRNIPIDLLEKTAILAKQNKEAMGTFTFEDYEEKVDSILKVVENLADQVSELKERLESYEDRAANFKPIDEKGNSKEDKKEKERNAMKFLEDIGELPELPKLSPQKIKKSRRSRRKK